MFQKIKKLSIIATPSIKTYVVASFIVLLAFLSVTFWTWNNAKNNIKKEGQTALDSGVNSATELINRTITTYGEILRSTAGIYNLDTEITEEKWLNYIKYLDIVNRYPGLQGMAFSQVVPANELSEFLANNKQADGSPYTIYPNNPREVYVINRYVISEEENFKSIIGYDIFTEPSRSKTMELARDTGKLAVTGNVPRLRDKQPGINLFVPIYKRNMSLSSIEERRAAILGYVSSGVKIRNLMDGLFSKNITKDSAIQLYDSKEINNDRKVYESETYSELAKRKNLIRSEKTFNMYGHDWTLVAYISNTVPSLNNSRLPNYILYGGITLSFLISAILLIVMISRARAISNEKNREVQEVKDNLISLASHQLRTPATGVKQFISMVLDGYAGKINKEQKIMLEKAYVSNERQLEIINQILHVTRADSGRLVLDKTKVEINELIRNLIEEHRQLFETRQQKVYLKTSAKKINVYADPQYLSMAIDNLLSNANKYSYIKKRINISIQKTKDEVIIAVADNGVGISPEDHHLLFQKFSRIHNDLSVEAGGNGIGLYLCREIIDLHGGTIDVESEPKKGTIFTIKLPIV